jgi:hypothetical protein
VAYLSKEQVDKTDSYIIYRYTKALTLAAFQNSLTNENLFHSVPVGNPCFVSVKCDAFPGFQKWTVYSSFLVGVVGTQLCSMYKYLTFPLPPVGVELSTVSIRI